MLIITCSNWYWNKTCQWVLQACNSTNKDFLFEKKETKFTLKALLNVLIKDPISDRNQPSVKTDAKKH